MPNGKCPPTSHRIERTRLRKCVSAKRLRYWLGLVEVRRTRTPLWVAAAAVRDVIVTPPPPPRHFDVMAEAARPHAEEFVRVVGALLDEQTNEWQVTRRYMNREVLANFIDPNNPQALLEARYAA